MQRGKPWAETPSCPAGGRRAAASRVLAALGPARGLFPSPSPRLRCWAWLRLMPGWGAHFFPAACPRRTLPLGEPLQPWGLGIQTLLSSCCVLAGTGSWRGAACFAALQPLTPSPQGPGGWTDGQCQQICSQPSACSTAPTAPRPWATPGGLAASPTALTTDCMVDPLSRGAPGPVSWGCGLRGGSSGLGSCLCHRAPGTARMQPMRMCPAAAGMSPSPLRGALGSPPCRCRSRSPWPAGNLPSPLPVSGPAWTRP